MAAQITSENLLQRARKARELARAMNSQWMRELLEHIAQEYERTAERAAIICANGPWQPVAASSKTSLFGI
jgi:hypothetical protein